MNMDWQAEVEKRKEELLAKTQELLKIPSILNEKEAKEGAPFGPEVARALQYMLDLSAENGMRTKNLDGYIGYGEFGEGEEMVGILCHLDVVPVGEGWSYPPFSGTIAGDRIISRGAIDDKGPTMAAFFAAKIVKELGLPLKRRVRLIFGGDEESQWRCVEHYFAREEMPALGFAPDADFPLIYAEKGLMDVRLSLHQDLPNEGPIQLVSFHSGQRSNVVPDYAEAIIRAADPDDLRSIAKLFDSFMKEIGRNGRYKIEGSDCRFEVEGISAHGSLPDRGVNAGLLMAQFLHRLELDERGETFIDLLVDSFVDDPFGQLLGIETIHEEMGKLTVNAGVIHYPKHEHEDWQIAVNIRYPANITAQEIREKIRRKMVAHRCRVVSVDDKLTPHYLDKEDPLVETLLKIYRKHTGDDSAPLAIGGATYARALKKGVAFGPLAPGREDVAHQKDEYILIDDLLKATAIYAEAIYELANMD